MLLSIWIFLLRVIGTVVLIVGVGGGTINSLALQVPDDFWWALNHVWFPVVQNLMFSVLCFAVAEGLKAIQQIGDRIERATARRRQPPRSQSAVDQRSIAPDAPAAASTARYLDEAETARTTSSAGRSLRRIDQEYIDRKYAYRIPDPKVRAAPEPSRTTPGTEDQYTAKTQQLSAYRPPAAPAPQSLPRPNIEADRDVLKRGRDNYLRQLQAAQSRKQSPKH